jgi:hypothetical protein
MVKPAAVMEALAEFLSAPGVRGQKIPAVKVKLSARRYRCGIAWSDSGLDAASRLEIQARCCSSVEQVLGSAEFDRAPLIWGRDYAS